MEKQARKNNIVFFGIEETENSYQMLENIIIDFVNKYFSLDLDHRDIQEVKRIGKKGEMSRPIIATFTTLGTKIKIFKQRRALKETTYYITEDYPKQILERRKELQEQAKLEREKGNTVKIKYDKLMIIPKNKSTGNNKRMLTLSPETPNNVATNAKASKKIRQHTQIRTTSSLSEGTVQPSMLNFLVSKNANNTPSDQYTTADNY